MTSRRDVERDLRVRLAQDARICVAQLRGGGGHNTESIVACWVERSFGSQTRLLEARTMLADHEVGEQALLFRASRHAAYPVPPAPPRPFSPPDAPRP